MLEKVGRAVEDKAIEEKTEEEEAVGEEREALAQKKGKAKIIRGKNGNISTNAIDENQGESRKELQIEKHGELSSDKLEEVESADIEEPNPAGYGTAPDPDLEDVHISEEEASPAEAVAAEAVVEAETAEEHDSKSNHAVTSPEAASTDDAQPPPAPSNAEEQGQTSVPDPQKDAAEANKKDDSVSSYEECEGSGCEGEGWETVTEDRSDIDENMISGKKLGDDSVNDKDNASGTTKKMRRIKSETSPENKKHSENDETATEDRTDATEQHIGSLLELKEHLGYSDAEFSSRMRNPAALLQMKEMLKKKKITKKMKKKFRMKVTMTKKKVSKKYIPRNPHFSAGKKWNRERAAKLKSQEEIDIETEEREEKMKKIRIMEKSLKTCQCPVLTHRKEPYIRSPDLAYCKQVKSEDYNLASLELPVSDFEKQRQAEMSAALIFDQAELDEERQIAADEEQIQHEKNELGEDGEVEDDGEAEPDIHKIEEADHLLEEQADEEAVPNTQPHADQSANHSSPAGGSEEHAEVHSEERPDGSDNDNGTDVDASDHEDGLVEVDEGGKADGKSGGSTKSESKDESGESGEPALERPDESSPEKMPENPETETAGKSVTNPKDDSVSSYEECEGSNCEGLEDDDRGGWETVTEDRSDSAAAGIGSLVQKKSTVSKSTSKNFKASTAADVEKTAPRPLSSERNKRLTSKSNAASKVNIPRTSTKADNIISATGQVVGANVQLSQKSEISKKSMKSRSGKYDSDMEGIDVDEADDSSAVSA